MTAGAAVAAGGSGRKVFRPYQGDLFDPMPVFARGSRTSMDAAERVRADGMSARQRRLVAGFVIERGARGATRPEISDALGIKIQSVCPRVHELTGKARAFEGRAILKEDGRRRNGSAVLVEV